MARRFQGFAGRGTPSRRAQAIAAALCPAQQGSMRNLDTGPEKMPVRLKKLIGTVLLILLVIVYALAATTVAVAQLAESGPLTHFVFFLLSGLLWILPAMAIIKWMVLPPKAGR